jgi:hypothetical protein
MSSASWNFFPLRAIFALEKRKCNQENWNCLHKSGCEVLAWCESPFRLLIRESVWDELRADLPFPQIFVEDWRIVFFLMLVHLTSFREPMMILCHNFTDICDCDCISRGWRAPASWIILKILTPVFNSFKPFTYTSTT